MKLFHRFCRSLFAPLVYLAALLLLLEDWLWDIGMRVLRRLSSWPPLHRLEDWICSLGPYAALTLFVLPAALLFPVKLLALWAMANGHALLGLLVILLAKLAGAAAVARIFLLTRPVLMTIVWFARLLHWFLALKERWITRLRATAAWRRVDALAKAWRHWRRHAAPAPGSWTARFRRLLRRFRARWRAR
ncbi:putative membrane protein [Janthinobacterium sp. HH01]|uniref:hypothetical protein n=1 Tax=Janthinobacterium sp. HH01 TaxID=1198452 RepID=UPI0002AEBF1A|nr:hypothetical protein [Janthinobacterium sp. HH01]ELX10280.1 putative membrane protein [Janthinobacterium sp. HH01]